MAAASASPALSAVLQAANLSAATVVVLQQPVIQFSSTPSLPQLSQSPPPQALPPPLDMELSDSPSSPPFALPPSVRVWLT